MARLPEDLGRRFLVFVDTEEEFDWDQPFDRSNRSVTAMEALPEGHRFFHNASAKPIYMVDYPVVDDDWAANILAELKTKYSIEIGAQLHPWVTPPFDEEVTPENSFVANLPVDLQRAKLKALTDRIADRFGERPLSYRAGRYGIGEYSSALLEELGYRMDVSVRALFDYRQVGGPDFSKFGTGAFWAGAKRSLLELPLTATYTGPLRRWGAQLYSSSGKAAAFRAAMARSGLLQRVSLTPEGYPLGLALRAIDNLLDDGSSIFSLSYHSPSLAVGHTPYVRDQNDLRKFYRWWDGVFEHFAKHGVTAIGASEFLSAAEIAK